LEKDARRSISQGLGHLGPDDTQNASTLNNKMLQNQHDSNKSEANQHGYLIPGISPSSPFPEEMKRPLTSKNSRVCSSPFGNQCKAF
jgi:hypothetical protein